MKFVNINYMKWIKLVIGAVAACLLAQALKLQYSVAAGIITLLSIQDTKKETILISVKRIIIFVVMTVLSALIFPTAGFSIWGFGIILLPYLFICLALKMPEAIAPIAVLCTHYMASASVSVEMIYNEFMILMIGAGIGVLFNLFMPDNMAKIKAFQKETDQRIMGILHRMSVNLLKEDKSEYTGSCFADLEQVLGSLKKEAKLYMDNHVIESEDYFLQYMNMRLRQCSRLKQIYEDIVRIHIVVDQAKPISDFLEKISVEFSEENDVEELLTGTAKLEEHYRKSELPKTREEFESRAILFEILSNIKAFLQIKRDFATSQSSSNSGK